MGGKDFSPRLMKLINQVKNKDRETEEVKEKSNQKVRDYLKSIQKVEEPEVFSQKEILKKFDIIFKERNGIDFFKTKEHRKTVKHLAKYFAGDKSFEDEDDLYSLDKGILLSGTVGVGKTEIMKIMMNFSQRKYMLKSVRDINTTFLSEGVEGITRYMDLVKRSGFMYGWLFDDVGEEDQVNHFGNKVYSFDLCMTNMYAKKMFGWYHMTTNLSMEDLEKKYGERLVSRMYASFNIIHLAAKQDFRKINR